MLQVTIETGISMRVIRPAELKRVNVDTTVQTKAIRFPTDARLYQRMREGLVKTARAEGLTIKQSYEHVGRRVLMQSSRYAHARQMKRARACTRKLKMQLGRIVREIERQIESCPRTRHNKKAWQSKSLSRSIGLVVSTRGVTSPLSLAPNSMQAKA